MKIFYDESAGTGDGSTVDGAGTGEGSALPEGAFSLAEWKTALPEDLREHTSLAKYTDLEGAIRGGISAQSMIGKDLSKHVELPGADDAEGRLALMRQLGAPEEAADYKLTLEEGAPEWLAPELAVGQWFTKACHENGVHPAVAQNLFAGFATLMGETAGEQLAQTAEDHEAETLVLQGEWGDAFAQNIAAADFAITKLAGEEANDLRAAIDTAKLGTHPALLKVLSAAGKLLAEGSSEGQAAFTSQSTPSEAKASALELQAQAFNETDPMKKRQLTERATKAFAKAYPGNAVGA